MNKTKLSCSVANYDHYYSKITNMIVYEIILLGRLPVTEILFWFVFLYYVNFTKKNLLYLVIFSSKTVTRKVLFLGAWPLSWSLTLMSLFSRQPLCTDSPYKA